MMPSEAFLAAGALGGPVVIYATTPLRNALTVAASDTSLSLVGCYREAFSRGLVRGWTGGQYYAIASSPGFVTLGPVYHACAEVVGPTGGVALSGIAQSLICHGAERKNAQLSFNLNSGCNQTSVIAFNPFGAGLGIHITRNIIAAMGMRVLCAPITSFYEDVCGHSSATITLMGDFSANIVSACASMPLHQLWNFTVCSPDMWGNAWQDQLRRMKQFLQHQYISPSGTISHIFFRDAGLRCAYIATLYTSFVNLERGFVKHWPSTIGD